MKLGEWFGLLLLLISLYILWEIRFLLLLVFAAVLVAVALDGAVNFLRRWRIAQGIAIALTLLALLAVIVTLVSLILPPFTREFEELVKLLPKGFQSVGKWLEEIQVRIVGETVFDFSNNGELLRQLQAFANPLLSRGLNFFFDTIGGGSIYYFNPGFGSDVFGRPRHLSPGVYPYVSLFLPQSSQYDSETV